jgi:ribosome maturation factor RimP
VGSNTHLFCVLWRLSFKSTFIKGFPLMVTSFNVVLTPRQHQRAEQALLLLAEQTLDSTLYVPLAAELLKEPGQWIVRLYVESTQGRLSLEACGKLCQQLYPLVETLPELQALEPTLEVSSPGLFRALKTPKELTFYTGRVVQWAPVCLPDAEGRYVPQTALLKGVLKGFEEAPVRVLLEPVTPAPVTEAPALSVVGGTQAKLAEPQWLNLEEAEGQLELTLAPEIDWPDS